MKFENERLKDFKNLKKVKQKSNPIITKKIKGGSSNNVNSNTYMLLKRTKRMRIIESKKLLDQSNLTALKRRNSNYVNRLLKWAEKSKIGKKTIKELRRWRRGINRGRKPINDIGRPGITKPPKDSIEIQKIKAIKMIDPHMINVLLAYEERAINWYYENPYYQNLFDDYDEFYHYLNMFAF